MTSRMEQLTLDNQAGVLPLLQSGIVLANQRLRLVILDLVWKFAWLTVSTLLVGGTALWLIGRIGSVSWEGPDLTVADPIILLLVARELWDAFAGWIFVAFLGVFALIILLRIFLEACFRGGAAHFWIFAGSNIARLVILSSVAIFLSVFVLWDRTASLALAAAAVMLCAWFMLAVAETLLRNDALDVFARDLFQAVGVLGVLFAAEFIVGAVL